MDDRFIFPQWPTPVNVKSLITTRLNGASEGAFSSFNLAAHVGDSESSVLRNRAALSHYTGHDLSWLKQTHSTEIAFLKTKMRQPVEADGAITFEALTVCAVLTADCLPILICNTRGDAIAAVHAGWRGLADGILSRAVEAFSSSPETLMAYIGPGISKNHFEVGYDVIEAFENGGFTQLEKFCEPSKNVKDKFYLDLVGLAQWRLKQCGVSMLYGGEYCTYSQPQFYSYRRDGLTGRFASLIWFE